MTASLSHFHQWLLASPPTASCAIVVHCADAGLSSMLIREVAAYLNEYDDDDGRWLPATPQLLAKIARDAPLRQFAGAAPTELPTAEPALAGLAGLSQRGHVVLSAADSPPEELESGHLFHAGVDCDGEIRKKCHVILNSALMGQKCIAHIIGDVFLEWLHCDVRRGKALHELRSDGQGD